MIYIAISIYIIILVLLLIYYLIIERGLVFIYANLLYSIENLNYDFTLLIYQNKKDIIKFNESLDVLYDNKKKYLKNFSYETKYFKNYLNGLKNDFKYLEELINKKLYDFKKIMIVEDLLDSSKKMANSLNIYRKLLYILTLGIFMIYVSQKKYY